MQPRSRDGRGGALSMSSPPPHASKRVSRLPVTHSARASTSLASSPGALNLGAAMKTDGPPAPPPPRAVPGCRCCTSCSSPNSSSSSERDSSPLGRCGWSGSSTCARRKACSPPLAEVTTARAPSPTWQRLAVQESCLGAPARLAGGRRRLRQPGVWALASAACSRSRRPAGPER